MIAISFALLLAITSVFVSYLHPSTHHVLLPCTLQPTRAASVDVTKETVEFHHLVHHMRAYETAAPALFGSRQTSFLLAQECGVPYRMVLDPANQMMVNVRVLSKGTNTTKTCRVDDAVYYTPRFLYVRFLDEYFHLQHRNISDPEAICVLQSVFHFWSYVESI